MQTRLALLGASLFLFLFDSLALAKAAGTPAAGLWGGLTLAAAGLALTLAKGFFPKG